MNKVTVIIPNYNGLRFMEPCFAALRQQKFKEFDILVVDNGSQDGSVEWLKDHEIPSIFLEENTGFSGAVNVGIRACETPYVILLNNDTEPYPDYVGELVRCMDRFPEVFSASSKMLQLSNRELMDDAGDMYSVLGWAYQRGVGQPASRYSRARQVFAACAGAAIYRREVFEEIGYFDESHFAYLEDIDVGYRAKIFGYKNVYCPTAKVCHVGSGTSGSKYNSFKVRLAARNSVYLNYKNMPLPQLLLNSVPLAAGMAVKYGFFRKIGFGADYVSGLKEGFSTRKNCYKVAYRPEHFKNYVRIQWELIAGTALYVWEFGRRQLRKAAGRPV
ncbi:glycosyl transferase family 2 [Lachnoclostridium sp. An14]|uniref:glycosyltransferase family 2 protein n=1 Tax=Lachnoclostridium sp. An14 TaxID=1965562 RepID=UPI000B3B0844|nr:glycosyltransferase family 2 protein [Lachnoclostridium sp. An14]OUQ12266.1 glycosyl transferase family 2 [Lachnoclostridium sp. An14]